jgi:2-methylcitrate dehydratase
MKRREFLARSATAVSASLLVESVRSDGYRFVGSALAAGEGDRQKATLEQKFAEFALSIKYEALPADVIASAKRVLLDTLGCAFGSVGSEPATSSERGAADGDCSLRGEWTIRPRTHRSDGRGL